MMPPGKKRTRIPIFAPWPQQCSPDMALVFQNVPEPDLLKQLHIALNDLFLHFVYDSVEIRIVGAEG